MTPAAPDAPAVQVKDLEVRYGPVVAVTGLSLTAERGQVTALLGPNGAGKTTTVETVEGYRTPTAGQVRVLGWDPQRDRAQVRRRIGVMLQAHGAYPAARVGEVLAATAAMYADPVDPEALLDRLGLTAHRRQLVKRLSGGQAQRLMLALAVVGRPDVVFLDEPTAGLDPQARRATWELIGELRTAGVGVILTTHYLDEAEHLADHLVIVDGGRVVAAGTPRELTGAAAGAQAVHFSARPGLDLAGLAAALPEGCALTQGLPGEYQVTGTVGPETLAAVTAWCAAHQVMPEHLRVGARSLEDVFLELTGRELRG